MCLHTNERYKTYQTGFSFHCLCHALCWDLGVLWGVWGIFFLNFNQSWYVSYLYEWQMQQRNFLVPHPLGPWGGKSPNIIKSQLLSQIQIFLNQTLCVFSQMKDIKHIRFSLGLLGHAQGFGTWWCWGSKI